MAILDDLTESLRRGRNADGGWGYYREKTSRLEPTAWGTLALHAGQPAEEAAVLRNWPSADGLLLEHAGGEPNYGFHGLALLVMNACGVQHRAGNASLAGGLQRVKGIALAQSSSSRQNNSLQAWSWIEGTFSWVEPTAWCLLALKKSAQIGAGRVDSARVDEAERLLIDRSCVSGGWNYGNSDSFGQDLRPYVPTTAVALLAMQDRRAHPVVGRSLDYLEKHATSERSGSTLALVLLALRVYGRRNDEVREALIEQMPLTMELGNQASIAMALCALGPERAYAAVTL